MADYLLTQYINGPGETVQLKTVSYLAGIVVAVLSGTYTLIQLRRECGSLPLLDCAMQAAGLRAPGKPSAGTAEQTSVAGEAKAATERYRREREEAERRVAMAEEARKAAEEKLRADQTRRRADEQERAAAEAARRARESEARPTAKLWLTATGSLLEYHESNSSVLVVAKQPSQAAIARGAGAGDNVFTGTRRGSRIEGETLILAGPGCSVRVPATLTIEPSRMTLQVPFTPAPHCGYSAVGARTDVWTPAR